MTHAQSGILLEHSRFGIFIEAMIQPTELEAVRRGCKVFCQALSELQMQFPDDKLGAVIAFGPEAWRSLSDIKSLSDINSLSNINSAPELKPFQPLGKGLAPATQRDMLIHIQSLRHDINFSMAQAALSAFGSAIEVIEETHGFRWIEERDLSGFIDGTENPKGSECAEVALIQEGRDQGGSYVVVQRYEHNLNKWHRFSDEEQEKMIGRTKKDSIELEEHVRNQTSHVSRVVIEENGEELAILRRSLPYGTASGKQGLFFIAYCYCLHNIEQQLLSMFGERDGKHDDLLRMSKPVTGSYYFAPSLTQLQAL
ncbi:formate acetyltransferase [Xenorhabdus beddingii]|uniref:Formate acetyltransferase n=1 Tax=Xenorhabdus beddingii TaxID=40578 RepID=A0A1Y2SIA6_9GAMM|nr:Dyp-type peroxidase [Xenorhabdus beddingii]OTA17738.1 formate acetyltransferase [Xenorhabdus beddingii]